MDERILGHLKDLSFHHNVVVNNSLLDELCEILYGLGVNSLVEELSDEETLISLD